MKKEKEIWKPNLHGEAGNRAKSSSEPNVAGGAYIRFISLEKPKEYRNLI